MPTFSTIFIGLVWLINGLFCKVMNGFPRHREIVATILGEDHAVLLTVLIGCGEIFLAVWIWSGRFRILCGWTQIALVIGMNVIEQFLVPELLLWGRWNFLWAMGFSIVVWLSSIRKKTP